MYTPIAQFDKSLLNSSEAYIHRASQFLAMIGKNYLENLPDDSNSNLGFDSETGRVRSREVSGNPKFSLNLNVPDWQLEVVNNGEVKNIFRLAGKSKNEPFNWLKHEIESSGLDSRKLKFIDHYEVSEHEVDLGQPFQELDIDIVKNWLDMRSNANIIMEDLNDVVGVNSEIRIWPHHFDTGTYYELGEKKAIGAGWAIADTLCDNPYLYIYGWNGNENIEYASLPDLAIGKWIVTEGWQGAVIESEQLSKADNQYGSIKSFMNAVVNFLKPQLT